jgi:hypothetical protein
MNLTCIFKFSWPSYPSVKTFLATSTGAPGWCARLGVSRALAGSLVLLLASACGSGAASKQPTSPPDSDAGASDSEVPVPGSVSITASDVDTRFVTREAFIAAGEMQISGEPLAEAMGRNLADYSRDALPTDIYFDTSPLAAGPWIDLPGFSTAVESYEYSKQPMNNLAFESGAGTSLVYGPLVNPNGVGGSAATALLATLAQHFAAESHALGRFVFPAGTFPENNPRAGDTNPSGAGQASENPLGWPGIWPTTHVFQSFDPTINPTSKIALGCAISSDDDPGASGALGCADYECDATTLHLANRTSQIDPTITPGADGFNGWKYGLWVLNYLQSMHDATEAPVTSVPDNDLARVGSTGNQIVGADDTGTATAAGTYLGSSDIEGFQAAMFIEEMDNRAADWLEHLTTTDGASLSGFATLDDALAYGYGDPLEWFPGAIHVSESDDGSGFPRPAYSLSSPSSDSLDLVGLAMAYAEFYALTDTANADVGGSQPALAYFDGDPFPADDQKADGEPTLHDRALAMMRVAIVDLDRLHADPATDYLVDDVTFQGATPKRGTTISTTSLAYLIIGLRTVRRALDSQLELYSNNTPDTAVAETPLDALLTHYPSNPSLTFSERLTEMLNAQVDLLYDHLTDSSGRAYDGWDLAHSARLDQNDVLDAHTAAVRGLFAAYLATGNVKYRDRALAVFNRIERVFYDPEARIYSEKPAPVDSTTFTPLRFALLQSTLRQVYELVAARPGNESLELELESRIARLNKLVLNGWDDRNENRIVDWPSECVDVKGGLPRGGLEMAERTLTGEIGSLQEQIKPGQQRTATSDRDQDCVPEIDDAHLPAALASSITFHITRK